jgi:hypothetical protein
MNNFKTYLFSILLLAMFSCDQNQINDPAHPTIYPLSYFPAHPGSYWKYVDENNDTFVYDTNPTYQLDIIEETDDTAYVPVYNVPTMSPKPIWGYDEHVSSTPNPLAMIVSDAYAVGYTGIVYDWPGFMTVTRKIAVKDTTIFISGIPYYPTIVVEEYNNDQWGYYKCRARYYTRDIGMVKEEFYVNGGALVSTRELIEYDINN